MSKNYEERILSEFANKVLSTDEPFAIKASEDSDLFYFHFIQAKYGSAKLVYRAKYIEKKFIFENANFDDSIKYELYAIAVKGTIYYFDDLLCFRISKHLYCKNIIKISYRGKTIFERKKCNER